MVILLVVIPAVMGIVTVIAYINYHLGLEDGSRISDREHRILDICCLYRQGWYTASEVAEMVTEVMEEGYK